MIFNRISDNGITVELGWRDLNDSDDIEHSMKSKDRPHPDFVKALAAFAPPIRRILQLPKDYALEIRSVTAKVDSEDGDVAGVIVHGVHDVPNSTRPLNIVSPLLDVDSFQKLSEPLDALFEEAHAYMSRAKRAQLDAFGKEEPAAPRFTDAEITEYLARTLPTAARGDYAGALRLALWQAATDKPTWRQDLLAAERDGLEDDDLRDLLNEILEGSCSYEQDSEQLGYTVALGVYDPDGGALEYVRVAVRIGDNPAIAAGEGKKRVELVGGELLDAARALFGIWLPDMDEEDLDDDEDEGDESVQREEALEPELVEA